MVEDYIIHKICPKNSLVRKMQLCNVVSAPLVGFELKYSQKDNKF